MARAIQILSAVSAAQIKRAEALNYFRDDSAKTSPAPASPAPASPAPASPAGKTEPTPPPPVETPWYKDPMGIGLASLLGAGGLTALLEYKNRREHPAKADVDEQLAKDIYG